MEIGSADRDWERIQVLFADALERPAGDRAAFLDRVCSAEPEVRSEIESLLAAHERAGDFLSDGLEGYRARGRDETNALDEPTGYRD